MGHLFDTPISSGGTALLVLALLIAFGFEFVNGFHDTANAVATVIYTKTLRPTVAVIWSGLFNLLGVALGGIAVAMSIIKLLPVELLAASGSGAAMAMVLALLLAAILWNLGTWYLGLPASSSHTLIGAIVGVGLANSLLPGHTFGDGINWHKVQEIGLSLVISPIIGLGAAAGLLWLSRRFLRSPELHRPPEGDKPPPGWVRALLIGTCTGVSFSHGSNDGQKGVGLVMLILIGLLPADYALNASFGPTQIADTVAVASRLDGETRSAYGGDTMLASNQAAIPAVTSPAARVLADLSEIRAALAHRRSVRDVPPGERFAIRSRILRVDAALGALERSATAAHLPDAQLAALRRDRATLRGAVDYAPRWVLLAIALALGVGTMIGWKRIVVTVGEKIGKGHLTYAQGASAELVAMCTIGLSGALGLPVSTTHVLSSGIAGTMVAQRSGLQRSTVRNIALAWLLTLPAAVLLSGVLFLGLRAVLPGGGGGEGGARPAAPAVRFERGSEEATVVVPGDATPLRLRGSNTMGRELAPALAEAFLRGRGAADVARHAGQGGHAWVVSGRMPGEAHAVEVQIDAEGSGTAFEALAGTSADIGMASRPATEEEARRILQAGRGDVRSPLVEHVVGLDGIAVIVSPSNPLRVLSTEQLAAMFSGEATHWPAGAGPAGPVHLYTRDDRSGTQEAFRAVVLGGRPIAPGATAEADNAALADAVADDPLGIGFVAMDSTRRAAVVSVSESGAAPIAPSRFSVATEDYPLSRRLYLYVPRPSGHPLADDFVDFALSPAGQLVVRASGFVDLAASETEPARTQCDGCPPAYLARVQGARRLPLNFRFRVGSSELDNRAVWDAQRLVGVLGAQHASRLLLLGFSDGDGQADTNVALSRERAEEVSALLRSYGVSVSAVDGFGAALPVASNGTAEGRERNRRVEVWLSQDGAPPAGGVGVIAPLQAGAPGAT